MGWSMHLWEVIRYTPQCTLLHACMHVCLASLLMPDGCMGRGRAGISLCCTAHTASLCMHADHDFWSGNCQCSDPRPVGRPDSARLHDGGEDRWMDGWMDARSPFRPFSLIVLSHHASPDQEKDASSIYH
jgi:hypothetical protein